MATKQRATQNEQILSYLATGKTLWQKRALKQLGVRRLSARVAELRAEGYPIYRNGVTYRLGTPSREMIATAYKVAGASVFG